MIAHLQAHPCVDCGEGDPVVLDFDHLPGVEKRFEIARAVNSSTRAWPAILREIGKCEVVCANCHRRRTAARAGHRRHLLSQGLPVEAPEHVGGRRRVPHGGGAKGRRGCRCDACLERRNAYAREWRARSKAVASDPERTKSGPT